MKLARTMVLAAILFLIAAFHQAHAQVIPPCLPALDQSSLTASTAYSGVTKNGAWVYWYCYDQTTLKITKVIYVGTLPEFAKVGGRMATIAKSATPLQTLQTLGNRITVLPLNDPSLAAIVADMKASMK